MASADVVKAELEDEMPEVQIRSEGKIRYKSWRKKYRKMRLGFEELMEEANQLFIAEHKARSVARRLQEEIDQILEILVDINEDSKTPSHLRWDLDRPSTNTEGRPCGKSLADYEKRVTHTSYSQNPSLKSLLPPDLTDIDDTEDPPPAYMTIEHEEEYLGALDMSLSAMPPTEHLPPNVEAIHPNPIPRSRTLPTDRDFALHCPVSVHNWLKNNQPQVSDQQKEKAESEKGEESRPRGPVGRVKKEKSSLSRQDLNYDGLEDDVGFDAASDVPGSGRARGRKKRDDDAYRPKGGHSKAQKRKREKDDVIEVKGKKLRKSGLSMGEDA